MNIDSIERIRRNGEPLEAPSRVLPARAAFTQLTRPIPRHKILVAIYEDATSGLSASTIPDFDNFKVIRRAGKEIRYYAVQKGWL